MTPASGTPAALLAARMVTAAAERPMAIRFRTACLLDQPPSNVRSARLYATAHGVYEASVNGHPVTDAVLAPGWTSYEWRLAWQEYDVTGAVTTGPDEVRVEAIVGNGWWRGGLAPFNGSPGKDYGTELGFLAGLEIRYADGHQQTIATSPAWEASTSEVTQNSLYDGECIDARRRGVHDPLIVAEAAFDHRTLVPQSSPPVRRQEVIRPERVWTSPGGRTLVDFGQNLVGWVRLSVVGPAGTTIVLRHAEALEDGELATEALRTAQATDAFVLSGGEDTFEPTLTFHGFRYVEVTGWPGELTPDSLEAVVVGSDLRRTGWFECSDPRVNQLVHNSVWGQKGNFLAVPTDCPQRDERLGWTGDIAVFAPAAAFQFDVADFLDAWLLDLDEEQRQAQPDRAPWVVPDVLKLGEGDQSQVAAIWSDAAVWVPLTLWQAYGDLDRLARHYPMMVCHLEAVERHLSPTGLWDTGFQFGDWLDPDAPADDAARAKADPGVVATASAYRSARFVAEAARLLGTGDEDRWEELATRLQDAFHDHYVHDGVVRSDCTTANALALHFGLLDGEDRLRAAARLADLVRAADYRATTGFAGTPYVTWALSENGYADDAYRLLLQDQCPSWLYQVGMGATTMWERWDSVLPDGTLNDPAMTSLNHYAFGAICDWLYQVVAGVRPAEPGYRRILLQPRPSPGIDWVHAAYDSVVGRIEVNWRLAGGEFVLDATLPDGVPTDVVLPNGDHATCHGGSHRWAVPYSSEMSVTQ